MSFKRSQINIFKTDERVFILIANFGLLINILGGLFLVVSGVLWVI